MLYKLTMDIIEKSTNPIIISKDFQEKTSRFLIIDNMKYEENRLTGFAKNIFKNISDTDFKVSILESALDNDLDLFYLGEGLAVFEGKEKNFDKVKEECGPDFSYAVSNLDNVKHVIEGHAESIKESDFDKKMREKANIITERADLH